MKDETSTMTKRLIEEWLPIADLGIESVRERTPRLHFQPLTDFMSGGHGNRWWPLVGRCWPHCFLRIAIAPTNCYG